MTLTIQIVDAPREFQGRPIHLVLVDKKKGNITSPDHRWQIEIEQKPNRKGEHFWSGDAVQHHGDGRRFVYFAWIDSIHNMFRRLKVDLNHVTDSTTILSVQGTMKDGSPACATAKFIEESEDTGPFPSSSLKANQPTLSFRTK